MPTMQHINPIAKYFDIPQNRADELQDSLKVAFNDAIELGDPDHALDFIKHLTALENERYFLYLSLGYNTGNIGL